MRMAAYIREDLKARIHAGRGLPAKLTLEGLSRHYGVSFTPVRAAVRELVRERFLRKGANGRLEVSADPPRAARARRSPEAPADRERLLAADALRRSLKGEAVFLREEAAAVKYGIGRTVVRQVFGRLVGTGLLEHVPRKGWRIRPLRGGELDAYLEIRETLELKALDLARPRLVRADLERMLAANEDGLDNDFHRYLLEKSNNRYLRDFFDRHGAYFTTLFDTASIGAVREMAAQHRRILQALLRRDWDGARRALAHHIRCQRPVLKKMMDRLATLPIEKWPPPRRL
ncbi:MAG: GntR family transcriptional regulator [Planctomycetes bacterium]|nr:GntR family transcriptional regulator [Planctomycetota bacterium]